MVKIVCNKIPTWEAIWPQKASDHLRQKSMLLLRGQFSNTTLDLVVVATDAGETVVDGLLLHISDAYHAYHHNL